MICKCNFWGLLYLDGAALRQPQGTQATVGEGRGLWPENGKQIRKPTRDDDEQQQATPRNNKQADQNALCLVG